jgi:hypothetical protein
MDGTAAVAAAMNGRRRFWIGAVGGTAPSLLNLALVDATNLLRTPEPVLLASYLIRVAVLLSLGGLWAWLHHREIEPAKVFELGLLAPAMVMVAMNASNVPKPPQAAAIAFAQSATAVCEAAKVRYMAWPALTAYEQVKQGLTGAQSPRTRFVIVGLHAALAPARAQAAAVVRWRGTPGEVFCAPDRYRLALAALRAGFPATQVFDVANP